MATLLTSYDLNGKKDSFANWISNLSPTDTFFVSTTGKEQVKNTMFQWQTDRLASADKANAYKEAEVARPTKLKPTDLHHNYTQILRKAVEVSDTADALVNWGRGKELAYQMEKAGKEIKRDLEAVLLQLNQEPLEGSRTEPAYTPPFTNGNPTQPADVPAVDGAVRKTASFGHLVADIAATPAGTKPTSADLGNEHISDRDTGAIVHKKTGVAYSDATIANKTYLTEAQLFDMTYNLYLAGSEADVIMFHPTHASFFSSLMEVGAQRAKLIDNMDTTLNKFVGSVIDPLGQQFKLVPNRWMPEEAIYFFNPKDFTQMILREPQKVQLAKRGSSERYMIEMEVGLRLRDPFAAAVLELKA